MPARIENGGLYPVRGINAVSSDVLPYVFEVLERGGSIEHARAHFSGNLAACPSLSQNSDSFLFVD